jgi:hypothetical protein
MLVATLFITACSARNRARRWLIRAREPRYLLGLIALSVYFYFAIVGRMRTGSAASDPARAVGALPALGGAVPALAGAALLLAAAISWLVPGTGRLLEFSQAEVQFLFPAPVSRRALIVHRLLRSQLGMLFAAVVPALAFALPSGSAVGAVRATLAVWLLLVASRVYFSGVTLARARLTDSPPALRRLARTPLTAVVVSSFLVGVGLAREFGQGPVASPVALLDRAGASLRGGATGVVLWPFVALVRPLFAAGWLEFALSAAMAAGVVAVLMAWVLASDEAFHDVTSQAVTSEHVDARGRSAAYRPRGTPWRLAVEGRPEGAFVWKTLTQSLRIVDGRVVLRLTLIVVALSILAVSVNQTRGFAGVAGLFAAAGATYAIVFAPQVVRLDLRQDLQHLDLLKTWPVRSSALVRGEIVGPALLLSTVAWGLIALALILSAPAFSRVSGEWRVAGALAAALLAPALIFGQYTIHNALALVFPAWVPLGSERPRGVDAMGQRLLTLGATWMALVAMTLPGALPAGALWFALSTAAGAWAMVPAAAVCSLVIGLEILLTTEALGPVYERLDLTAIERQC